MSKLRKFSWMITLMIATNVQAQEGKSFESFEVIVNELRSEAEESVTPTVSMDDWGEVSVHGGFGLSTSYVRYSGPLQRSGSSLMKGFEAHIGMNLFTRKARAEAIFRNYANESVGSDVELNLRELEGRVVFFPPLRDKLLLRMGAGMSVRNMGISVGDVANRRTNGLASSLLVGLERKVSPHVSLGPDISYRSPLHRDSIDKSAWDAALRLNATF